MIPNPNYMQHITFKKHRIWEGSGEENSPQEVTKCLGIIPDSLDHFGLLSLGEPRLNISITACISEDLQAPDIHSTYAFFISS